ncbi:MAG TPA: hypothetical protein VJ183_10160 [Chloroflexia bacterium]|nr:hypothetical protein [Chloroflexia bacterium]
MHTSIAQLAYRASTDSDFRSRLLADPQATMSACGITATDEHSSGSNRFSLLTLVQQATNRTPAGASSSKEGWFGEDSTIGGGLVRAALTSAPQNGNSRDKSDAATEGWFGGDSPVPYALPIS